MNEEDEIIEPTGMDPDAFASKFFDKPIEVDEAEEPEVLAAPEPVGMDPDAFADKFFSTPDPTEETDMSFMGTRVDPGFDLNEVFSRYEESLVKEDFLEDKDLQEIVYKSLEARGRANPNLFKQTTSALSRLAGGANVSTYSDDLREQPFEEVFETWQNWMRGLSSAQSVTTANELAYVLNQDDETKAQLASGYQLFDRMDNAFTGEGSWGEMGDAIWDYGRNAVWDPVNILTFGIGRATTAASSKVGMGALKKMVTKAGEKNLTGAVLRATPFVAPDLAFNVGVDAMEQSVKMTVGAQEEYSVPQAAAVAAGTILIPAVAGGLYGMAKLRKSKIFKGTAFDTPDLSTERALNLSKDDAWEILNKKVDKKTLNTLAKENFDLLVEGVDDRFGSISGDTSKFTDWATTKLYAEPAGKNVTQNDMPLVFFKHFFEGEEGVSKGYMQALNEAGFRAVPSMLEEAGGTTNIYKQAIEFVDDEVMEKIIKDFEKVSGTKLNIGYTSEEVAKQYASMSSQAGKTFKLISDQRKLTELGMDSEDIAKYFIGADKPEKLDPKTMQYTLSIYKRLLTSHLATTGANLKGFQQLVSLNTYADIFSSATYQAQSKFYKLVKGDADKAALYAKKAYGSYRSVARKVAGVFDPVTEYKYAQDLLDTLPEKQSEYVQTKLFRDIAGDGGIRDTAEMYNIDSKAIGFIDSTTSKVQSATLVRMQDEITKTWAFGSNFDRALERKYGVSAQQFFNDPENAFKLQSKEFQEVLDESIFKTLRETASVNWSLLPAKSGFRGAARVVEFITNQTPVGFVVPFGSFLNTTLATLGDLSGVNLVRHSLKVGMGHTLDYASGDFGELLGRTAAGWTAVSFAVPSAYEKVLQGFAWDQEVQPDGSIKEKTFIWPESVIDLSSTILAHGIVPQGDLSVQQMIGEGELQFKWDRIPDDLWAEFLTQSGGQAVRDIDDVSKTLKETLVKFRENPDDWKVYRDVLLSLASRPVQGVTRPLDPLNVAVGLSTGQEMNPDLRQGSKMWNEMFKYVDKILPVREDLPKRNDPLSGPRDRVDLGKQILGNRTSASPNLTKAMFTAAGIEHWKAIRWNGDPEIKNRLDGMAAPLFEREAIRQMKEHPDFFKYPQGRKEYIIDKMNTNVRNRIEETLEKSVPNSLNMVRILSGKTKRKVQDVMDRLGYEDTKLVDLLDQEDGLSELQRINFFVDNYDDLFYGDIK
jgi:hypothetical protein